MQDVVYTCLYTLYCIQSFLFEYVYISVHLILQDHLSEIQISLEGVILRWGVKKKPMFFSLLIVIKTQQSCQQRQKIKWMGFTLEFGHFKLHINLLFFHFVLSEMSELV